MATTTAPLASASSLDNTPKIVRFLDIHMIHPLLDYLREVGVYSSDAITKEKIRIFLKTNMLELVQDEINKIPNDPIIAKNPLLATGEISKRTNEIFAKIDNETENIKLCQKFFTTVSSDSSVTLENALQNGVTPVMLDEYYQFAKFKYDCGMYSQAEEMLGKYLSISQPQISSILGALWGRLACRILQSKWELSLSDFQAVKEAIENRSIAPMDQLRQRGWLLHWGLFVLLNQKDGVDTLYDLFSERIYLQTIENLCPWLLRYYTCAAILSSKRSHLVRDVLNEVQSMSYLYSDPLTQFIEALYDHFDLTAAQEFAQQSFQLLQQDFFFHSYAPQFLHQTRLLICEVYCGINSRVDIQTLSSILQLNEMETEKWIALMISGKSNDSLSSSSSSQANATSGGLDLVSSSSLTGVTTSLMNAKIDSEKKQVVIGAPSRAVHQRIVERTKDLNVRCGILNGNLENLMNEQGDYILIQQSIQQQK